MNEKSEWYWYPLGFIIWILSLFEKKEEVILDEEANDIDLERDEENLLFWLVIFIPVEIIIFFRNLFYGFIILITGGLKNNPEFKFKKNEARGSFSV